jgi:hypothetical protein
MTKYFLKFLRFFRSISISHSITKTREEKDLTLKLEKDILNLEDIMNSAPSELRYKKVIKTTLFYWGALTPGILSTIWKTGSPWI